MRHCFHIIKFIILRKLRLLICAFNSMIFYFKCDAFAKIFLSLFYAEMEILLQSQQLKRITEKMMWLHLKNIFFFSKVQSSFVWHNIHQINVAILFSIDFKLILINSNSINIQTTKKFSLNFKHMLKVRKMPRIALNVIKTFAENYISSSIKFNGRETRTKK